MRRAEVVQAAPGVNLVHSEAVNWTLLVDGDQVTLVDAGYPACHEQLVDSLDQVGRRVEDVVAVLVTHAHVDHIGGLPRLLSTHDVPVLTSPVEAEHARRERLEQATPAQVMGQAWRPRVLRWSLHLMRLGALTDVAVPSALGFDEPLDLPGGPVPIVTPGHTSGHTCFHLPQHGVLLTGDALVTGHPLSHRTGPQLLEPMFHHDVDGVRTSLTHVRDLAADQVLPGHGPLWQGAWSDAVDQALVR